MGSRSKPSTLRPKVLLLTGFAPLEVSRLGEMGSLMEPFIAIASIVKRNILQFTIPTIGAVAAATYIEERGANVEVKDFFLDDVGDCKADIIGISSTFMGPSEVNKIAGFVRERNPASLIVLGGPLSWSVPPSMLLDAIPQIDLIVIGEGEQTFFDVIESSVLGRDPNEVPGVISRTHGVHSLARCRAHLDVDLMPMPNWKLMGLPTSRRLPVLPVETSRGCPYNCPYCSETHYWGKPPRYRRAGSVAAEIVRNVNEFGITTFRFTDSCFSSPPKRCADVCDTIYQKCKEKGITVKWSSYARVNNLTPYLLERMKRAGCVALDIGVESGDPAMLRRMGRKYSPDQAVIVAKKASELDIIVNFNIVVGSPGETTESIDRTIEMLDRAQPDTFACFLLFIAPNMTLSSYPDRYGLNGVGLSWRHSTMTSDDAKMNMERISRSVTGSCSFPGGEYVSCYLASLGYSNQQVRSFFKAALDLARGDEIPMSRSTVEGVCASLKNFW